MTEVFNDTVDVTLEIGGDPWYLTDAKVVLSRIETPNYVDLLMVPDPDETVPDLPDKIDQMIGQDFVLRADNALISERDSNADEDTLLFAGKLANISETGENSYEGIAYDPAQQAFAPQKDGGSIQNTRLDLGQPEYDYTKIYETASGTNYTGKEQVIKASELVQQVVQELNITDYEIELADGGVSVEGENGTYTGGYDRTLYFDDTYIPVKQALNAARERCEAEWWFDKSGTFHFGVPRPTRHQLQFITDADAGKTTPPYQSVRVIGSGAASAQSYARTNMEIEDKIVVEAALSRNANGDIIPNFGRVREPVFEYHNLEVSNDKEARSVARKIIEDLGEQFSDGVVTVVGFPEIVPLDGIVMPQAKDEGAANYRPKQPMGGQGYGVYKVVHRLNNNDGFITKIHCSGVTGVTLTTVSSEQARTSYDITITGTAGQRPLPGAPVIK